MDAQHEYSTLNFMPLEFMHRGFHVTQEEEYPHKWVVSVPQEKLRALCQAHGHYHMGEGLDQIAFLAPEFVEEEVKEVVEFLDKILQP